MADFKTPGVYIQEIASLPASIVPVATAIPAFVGYTAKRVRNGQSFDPMIPIRISSYLDYQEIFGDSFPEQFRITIDEGDVVTINDPTNFSQYLMTYQVYMYFSNGGGPCWIVSVGNYVSIPTGDDLSIDDLLAGLQVLEEEDEPTLLIVPESVFLSPIDRKTLHDQILAQCAKLQDRFAILDALHYSDQTAFEDAEDFRSEVGNSSLNYGSAYYPALKTILFRNFNPNTLILTDNRGGAGLGPFHGLSLSQIQAGQTFARASIRITTAANLAGDTFTIGSNSLTAGTEFDLGGTEISTAQNLFGAIQALADPAYVASRSGSTILLVATSPGESGALIPFTYTDSGDNGGAVISGGGTFSLTGPDKTLYNQIISKLQANLLDLYPSASMAGVYARVDSQRGVWKAPANVDIRSVVRPSIALSNEEQAILNVDATSGKSINAIRFFAGKGNLVWGARTLAGNDNEWRYIPVRRFYIFVEESIKKATEFVVFEPNDANTWLRVKTMCENFLSNLWREGALAGAKADQAFFVRIGLGQTMTSLDILEGRMNVEIGLAAVRPAEFIILKFSHKLQES